MAAQPVTAGHPDSLAADVGRGGIEQNGLLQAGEPLFEIAVTAGRHLGDDQVVLGGERDRVPEEGRNPRGCSGNKYTGTAGRIENSQIGTFLAYASPRGRTLIDWELYVPDESWIKDRERCQAAGIPDSVPFRTKPQQLRAILQHAIAAGPSVFTLSTPALRVMTARDGLTGGTYKAKVW